MRLLAVAIIATTAFAAAGALYAQTTNPARAAAWAGEDRYWADSEKGDFADFIKLFSDDFIGWPCPARTPQAKIDLKGTIGGLQPGAVLDRKATAMGSGFVITYYRVTARLRASDGKAETAVFNITHTWAPTKDGWRIAGGMCRPAPAE
jgi:hypothetical protein